MLIIDAFLGRQRQRARGGEEAKQRGVDGRFCETNTAKRVGGREARGEDEEMEREREVQRRKRDSSETERGRGELRERERECRAKQKRGVQETEKRASFVSQPCSLWLLGIQCTFTMGARGGEEEAEGVSAGDRPRLEVWQPVQGSEPCGQNRTTRSPSPRCTSLTRFPEPCNVFPGLCLVFLPPPHPHPLQSTVLHHADSLLCHAPEQPPTNTTHWPT